MLVVAGGGLLVMVTLVVLASGLGRSRVRVEAGKVTIGTVSKGLFKEFIPITGTVQPIKTVFLDAVQGGIVEEVFLEDGQAVVAGTPILRLGNQQFQMDAINREAQLLDQQNNLRNTRLNMDQQTNTWKQQLAQLDYDMKQVERTWRLNESLKDKGMVAEQEIARSREEFQLAQERRRLLVANIRNDSLFRRTQEGQIASSLDLIQDNLGFLHRALENLTVKAPIAGTLSGLRAEIGQTVAQGSRIAQIDMLDALKLRARVPEHYVSRVYQGLEATFAFAGRDFQLTVAKVFPDVSNGEFDVDFHFNGEAPEAVKRGQTVQVRLQLSEDMEAIMLPRGPFFQDTGGQWVYVLDAEGKATKREVKLGRQNPDMYEVTEGLQPGDRVVTSRYAAFNDADELIIQ
ncbi:MAG: efflux RND transporter periplasmic adaptor subunit [Flavobacteriales bacterium]|nr:efflux RND transporter periplasmic adaptor subunit [Flavobacteriales bacterium]